MKTVSVREFLRGEYKTITEPTLVLSYSRPLGVWQPMHGDLPQTDAHLLYSFLKTVKPRLNQQTEEETTNEHGLSDRS